MNLPGFLNEFSFSWRDAVDILILSFLVYRVLLLLYGTIANKLLWLFATIIILFLAAEQGGFRATQWVFANSWDIIVIVLLLIIQPELRQGVARIGITHFVGGGRYAKRPLVDEIVKAVAIMSAQRVGALIAIENGISMKHYTEKAVPIHADVKNELLRTLFFPDTPLHDGAVIISNGRIEAAGCFFPLTRQELKKTLGTRHRAGVGVSEETDALVIIVSEETGNISVALKGTLDTPLGTKELTQILEQWLQVKPKGDAEKAA